MAAIEARIINNVAAETTGDSSIPLMIVELFASLSKLEQDYYSGPVDQKLFLISQINTLKSVITHHLEKYNNLVKTVNSSQHQPTREEYEQHSMLQDTLSYHIIRKTRQDSKPTEECYQELTFVKSSLSGCSQMDLSD